MVVAPENNKIVLETVVDTFTWSASEQRHVLATRRTNNTTTYRTSKSVYLPDTAVKGLKDRMV
jgi:hypothetical protein